MVKQNVKYRRRLLDLANKKLNRRTYLINQSNFWSENTPKILFWISDTTTADIDDDGDEALPRRNSAPIRDRPYNTTIRSSIEDGEYDTSYIVHGFTANQFRWCFDCHMHWLLHPRTIVLIVPYKWILLYCRSVFACELHSALTSQIWHAAAIA